MKRTAGKLKTRFAATLLLFLTASLRDASGGVNRWTSAGPIRGEWTVGLAVDPHSSGTIYAGVRQGIYRSSDHGKNWVLLGVLAEDAGAFSIAVDPFVPTTLYASGGRPGRIFRSPDGGRSWTSSSAGLPNTFNAYRLATDALTQNTVYAATEGFGGIFRSVDGGRTWTSISQAQVVGVRAFAIDPHDSRRLYAGTNRGSVFRTTDGGASWHLVSHGFPGHDVMDLAVDPQNPSNVYAVTYRGGVFKSVNGGDSWRRILMSSHTVLAIDPANPSNLYGVLEGDPAPGGISPPPSGGVYQSTDGGESSVAFKIGMPHYRTIFRLAVEPNGRFLHASTAEGVYDYEIRDVRDPPIRLLPASQRISRTVSGNWTVLLDNAQTTDTEVALGSSRVDVVTVPFSVTIPVGSTSATFNEMRSSFFPSPGIATVTGVLPENLGGGIARAEVTVIPFIRSLSPASVTAGSPAFTLTVVGLVSETQFGPGSTIYWNGSPRPTVLGCPFPVVALNSCVNATISATDIATPGTAYVAVVNPPPSGGTNGLIFTITQPQQQVDIPTLSEWGMLALGFLLAGAGILVLRMWQS